MLWQDERQLPAKPGGMTKYKLQNVGSFVFESA